MSVDNTDLHARQRTLLGESGQKRLKQASVLVIGCGGLGAGAIPPLVAAGVGKITLLDDDVVDASDLNRQTLFTFDDVGWPKVNRTVARMRPLAPSSTVRGLRRLFTADDASHLTKYDIVLDCTNSLPSRLAISQACAVAEKPWIWASVDGWKAAVSVFTSQTPRWEGVVDAALDTPHKPQVLGTTAAIAGGWQAAEAIKVLTGQGSSLTSRLLVIDTLHATVRTIDLA